MIKKLMANDQSPSRRLLVIDDEENMRHMLSALLTKSGYDVDLAADGREGLKVLDQDHYDFILCDIKMPNMGGMEFLEAAGERIKETTVIMMSAYGTIETAIEAMKLGAMDLIEKPADLATIVERIKSAKAEKIILVEKKSEARIRDILKRKGW